MSEHDEDITIVGIEAENFRRLKVAKLEFVPKVGLVRVTGLTDAGKTSLLRGIAGDLGGAGEVHEESLREGAENGRFTLKLSNGYTVERRFTEANPKGYLDVVSPDGGDYGQAKLNTWLGERSFDPQAFFSLAAKKQRDTLFSIGTDPDLPEKLDAVREEYQETYDERTPVISKKRELGKIQEPEGERPDPIDTSAEMARLRELQAEERRRGDARQEAEKARDAARDALKAVEDAESLVERLKRQLAEAEAELDTAQVDAEEKRAVFEEAKEAWQALPDPSDEMEEVQSRIELADERQKEIQPWVRWEEAQQELEQVNEKEKELTEQLNALKQREADLLDQAGIPIDGISFNEDGELLLHGKSLEVASGRQRIELAVQVAIAANPKMRVCLLDEANNLDLPSMERLDELAKKHRFQIWAVRIGIEGPGEVVVEDGEAWTREDLVPAEDAAEEDSGDETDDDAQDEDGEPDEDEGIELPDWDKDSSIPADPDDPPEDEDEDLALGFDL